MKIISLGSSCSISYNLKLLGKRKESLPFDWIRVSRMSSVNNMIETQFQELWNKKHYIFKKSSSDFFLQDDLHGETKKEVNIYYHDSYLINFYHDFNKDTDFNISFEDFTIKYKRRVNRFFKIIADSEEIIFVREQIKPNHISNSDIEKFINLIQNINPKLNFKLLIIVNNFLNKKICLEQSKLVDIVEEKSKLTNWQRQDVLIPILNNYLSSSSSVKSQLVL